MESLWDKIIREAKGVSLTKEERGLMLDNIRNRVYLKEDIVSVREHVISPYSYHFRIGFSLHEKRFIPVAVFLILVVFGGTSFAANFALPGEALYSMKVNVNEEMESWIALSPNANARFEAIKADRRLKEIEKLTVQKKKITPKAKAQIKENFVKNAEKVKKIVAEIEASGSTTEAAQVKADFENNLEAHSVVLSKLASDDDAIVSIDDEGKSDIKEISALVDEHINVLKAEEEADLKQNTELKDKTQEKSKATDSKEKSNEISNKEKQNVDSVSDDADLIPDTVSVNEDSEESKPSVDMQLKVDTGVETKKENKEDINKTKQENSDSKEIDKKLAEKDKENKVKVEVKSILKELDLPVED